jgi:hypothetical protein
MARLLLLPVRLFNARARIELVCATCSLSSTAWTRVRAIPNESRAGRFAASIEGCCLRGVGYFFRGNAMSRERSGYCSRSLSIASWVIVWATVRSLLPASNENNGANVCPSVALSSA